METMTPGCFTGFIGLLTLLFVVFVVASQVSSEREAHKTHRTDDDGEPGDVPDSIITVYAPAHLPALAYVRVPARVEMQEAPAPLEPVAPVAIVPVCSVRCPTCELEAMSRHGYANYTPRPDCDNWALCERHRRNNRADIVLSEMGRWA